MTGRAHATHVELIAAAACRCAAAAAWSDRTGPAQVLVTIESLSSDYRLQMEAALEERNKERILTGQPRYEDIADMVTKYQEFEGEKLGMSRAEAEDAVQRPYLASGIWPAAGSGGARACLLGPQVLSYLQKKALMDEGAYSGDPQEAPSAGKRRADSLRNFCRLGRR